jgi:hypothetical protein
MKKLQPHHCQTSSQPIRTLDPGALEVVRGGDAVVAPRDPQSGLPTGKRT